MPSAVEVDLDRLGELADDGPVLAVDRAQAEHPALGSISSWVTRRLLDADAEQLRLEGHLGGPVERHQVPALAGPAADDVEPGGHRPQRPPAHAVVLVPLLVGLDAGRERSDGAGSGHPGIVEVPPVLAPRDCSVLSAGGDDGTPVEAPSPLPQIGRVGVPLDAFFVSNCMRSAANSTTFASGWPADVALDLSRSSQRLVECL